jgi:hypothetical protein
MEILSQDNVLTEIRNVDPPNIQSDSNMKVYFKMFITR